MAAPTDREINNPTEYRTLHAFTKAALASKLERLGVIYPTPRELVRLPKDELIGMVMEWSQPARSVCPDCGSDCAS
jgi:hypothetical protein